MPISHDTARSSHRRCRSALRGAVATLLGLSGLLAGATLQPARADQSPDEQVLAALRDAGSDLAKPHVIQFYLYFPTQAVASSMVLKVRRLGLDIVRVEKAATGSEWLLLATTKVVPTKDAIERLTVELTAIAESGEGVYDGWEAEVTK